MTELPLYHCGEVLGTAFSGGGGVAFKLALLVIILSIGVLRGLAYAEKRFRFKRRPAAQKYKWVRVKRS